MTPHWFSVVCQVHAPSGGPPSLPHCDSKRDVHQASHRPPLVLPRRPSVPGANVWCDVGSERGGRQWLQVRVDRRGDAPSLVLSTEDGKSEVARLGLHGGLRWRLLAPFFGVLISPPHATGSVGLFFDSEPDTIRATEAIRGCLEACGAPTPSLPSVTLPYLPSACGHGAVSAPLRAQPPTIPMLSRITLHPAPVPRAVAVPPSLPSTSPVDLEKVPSPLPSSRSQAERMLKEWRARPSTWTAPKLFGCSLQFVTTVPVTGCGEVPGVLVLLGSLFVECGGLEAEGSFRVEPSKTDRDAFRAGLESGRIGTCSSPHIAASLIKGWFRELKPKLLSVVTEATITTALKSGGDAVGALISSGIPPAQRAALLWLLNIACLTWIHEGNTRMTPPALATVFVPNLYEEDTSSMQAYMRYGQAMSMFFESAMRWQLTQSPQLQAVAAGRTFSK